MKKVRKVVVMFLCALVIAGFSSMPVAAATKGDLVRFIPTEIEIDSEDICVKGYFVNLNTGTAVSEFTDVEMVVYIDGEELCSGDFGTINSFTVEPLSSYYQSFTFPNDENYSAGTYDADESCYTKFSATFTGQSR